MDSVPNILQLFQAQVALRPGQLAVESADESPGSSLSYLELDRKSNQVAARLSKEGIARDSIVAVLSSRRAEMVVAIFGILKAGGAYLSLDASYPAKRLEFMVEDSQPALLLDTTGAEMQFAANCKTIQMKGEDGAIADVSDATGEPSQLDPLPSPSDLAYVIYTSGSTGVPKGVLLEHGGLAEMAAAHAKIFGVDETSRVLQFSSLSFDAAVSEIFMTLCFGGTLCLANPADLIPGRELIELLESRRISNVLLPPSVLGTMPDHPLPHLRTLIAGGERCTFNLVKRWAAGRDFFNAYGPTEGTVTATIHKVETSDKHDPPIGNARSFACVYVLDETENPVVDGEVGELYVGGNGVARGYLNRPDLTEKYFFSNPFETNGSQTCTSRMYRTGDLVRRRTDGAIEFVGRADRQIKVRGFRVELGEIESALTENPAVQQAAAKLVHYGDNDDRIVAYVVPALKSSNQIAETLRSWLADRLPPQSIPSRFITLEALPLTANNKIDYQALPEAELASGEAAGTDSGGKTAGTDGVSGNMTHLQSLIHASWCDQIGLDSDEVSLDDHFVELGGDSLIAAHIALRLESDGVTIRAQDVLDNPSVRQLADFCQTRV